MHYNGYVIISGQKPPTKNTEVFNNGNFASQEHNKLRHFFHRYKRQSVYDLMVQVIKVIRYFLHMNLAMFTSKCICLSNA